MDFMHRAAAWLAGGVVFAASCASVLAAAACLPERAILQHALLAMQSPVAAVACACLLYTSLYNWIYRSFCKCSPHQLFFYSVAQCLCHCLYRIICTGHAKHYPHCYNKEIHCRRVYLRFVIF